MNDEDKPPISLVSGRLTNDTRLNLIAMRK